MRRAVLYIFAVIGGLSLLGVVGVTAVIVIAFNAAPRPAPLPGAIVLSADLDRDLAEGQGANAVSRALFGDGMTLRDFLDALEKAGDDPRVKGLYARLGDDTLGLARVQQVRDAIAAFRAKGKFAIAFADTFGEFGPGTRPYYLATAFDQIWLQPMGDVGLTGLYSETPFLRDALGRIGVAADFSHRAEYKTAMNSLTESAMTAPQREEMEGLLSSLDGQIVRDVAAARKIPEPDLRALIDRAPLLADEAEAAHLVDKLGYRDEAIGAAQHRAGNGARFVRMSRYLDRAGHPHDSGAEIALIYGTGMITREGTGGSLVGASGFDAQKVAAAIRQAAADKNIRAILFRIDSPGGSVVASETVWREIDRAHRRGKPVIVSMGDVAGSGGYYIAAPADKIVAEPATLTGSVGVLAGKIVLAGLMQRLGVNFDAVERGANAGMFSAIEDFSPAAQHRLDDVLDRIYAGFKNRVGNGRKLTPEAVEAVAKGRVWTGEQAKANGLVDAVGGYEVALRLAKEAANIPADAPIDLVTLPKQKNPFAEAIDRLTGKDDTDTGLVGSRVDGIFGLIGRVEAMVTAPGTVEMPRIGEVR
ncbi:MAG TPA: signal peptide peptidase SppA [Stellaceae bacterium]|jgi:protease-4|nr:signal peptide peptidase SppA [Stellaceae bacterium]